jgi:hypothetical protein
MFKATQACCGDCMAFFGTWARILELRSTEGRTQRYFLDLPMSVMKREIRECTEAIEESLAVAKCLGSLASNWSKDWREPFHRNPEELTRRLEALRKLCEDD